MNALTIAHLSARAAARFAAEELCRYLGEIRGRRPDLSENPDQADIVLGTFAELSRWGDVPAGDDAWNDATFLRSVDGKLFLGGPNDRSILFAVYDYLERLGCRWTAPGPNGDFVPIGAEVRLDGFDVYEKADYPFRGLSVFHKDPRYIQWMVEWMPKRKYNVFFMEGFDEDRPGDRWSIVDGKRQLQHIEIALGEKDLPWEERLKGVKRRKAVVEAARLRGLLIERYGHGWNYGLQEHYATLKGVSLDVARDILQAKGKIQKGASDAVGTWFQICMSVPEVKTLYVEHIVDYLKRHKAEIDIAAIWLGDGYDNACQCDECVKKPFSDWYLEILAEVARQAKDFAPEMKLEGLLYFVTLEPPTQRWLDGLDNVVLILAPWNRCHVHAFDDPACRFPNWKPSYRDNRSHDRSRGYRPLNADHLEAFQGWRRQISNPCHFFDYYVLTRGDARHALSYDCGPLARDIRDYRRLGFDGVVSCQPALPDDPVNLVTETVGRTLWDSRQDAATLREQVLSDRFGDRRDAARTFLDTMGQVFAALYPDPHGAMSGADEKTLAKTQAALDALERAFPEKDLSPRLRHFVAELKFDAVLVHRDIAMNLSSRDGDIARIEAEQENVARFIRSHRETFGPFRDPDNLERSFQDGARKLIDRIRERKS